MNKIQRTVIIIGAIAFLITGLFPQDPSDIEVWGAIRATNPKTFWLIGIAGATIAFGFAFKGKK